MDERVDCAHAHAHACVFSCDNCLSPVSAYTRARAHRGPTRPRAQIRHVLLGFVSLLPVVLRSAPVFGVPRRVGVYCTCSRARVHTHTHPRNPCPRTPACAHEFLCTHALARVYANTHAHVYARARAHTHTHVRAHRCTCRRSASEGISQRRQGSTWTNSSSSTCTNQRAETRPFEY